MNIPPPPTDPAWAQISDKIHAASTKVANQPKAEAAKEYRKDHGIMDKQIGDAIVSCDGTWQRRGFQSKNGVDTILSVNGQKCKVLDTIVLRNYCSICATKRKELKDVDKYKEWFETEYTNNYEGSAGGMEPHGMLIGFRRSGSLHKLNYTGYYFRRW